MDFEAYVAEELAKLDQLERRVLLLALAGGDQNDPKVNLPAVDRELSIMERRAKLLGLDRPTRVDTSMRVQAETVMDAEIRALIAQMRDGPIDG